jgi:hypothetical protein
MENRAREKISKKNGALVHIAIHQTQENVA